MKKIQPIILGILCLMTYSCYYHSGQTIIGSGDIESMEVEVPAFTGVSVVGTCNVDIRTGDQQQVELFAQSQILSVMTYRVRNGILEIGFRSDLNVKPSKEISASIVIPEVDFVGVSGAADFILSGDAQESLDIYIEGVGNVDAFGMEVGRCLIRLEGSGNCQVNVRDELDIDISGVGNVTYLGTPNIHQDISGVGVVQSGS